MEEKKELLDQDERVVEIELERLRGFVNHTIRKHPVKRNALLCRLRYAIIFPGVFYDLPYCHLVCPA